MYKEVYHFSVIDELEEGKEVFALDTRIHCVDNLTEMRIKDVVALVKFAQENDKVIMFYKKD